MSMRSVELEDSRTSGAVTDPQPGHSTGEVDSARPWTGVQRVAFRFSFVYSLLYLASSTINGWFGPFLFPVQLVSQVVSDWVLAVVARFVLRAPPPALFSDGDGLGQWVLAVACLLLALVVTLVWSVADRRSRHHRKLHVWLRTVLRFALGYTMVIYGVVKILHLQMLPPHLSKLVQPFGDFSSTSLLWIFMGSSAAYSAFTGAIELLGGVLLFSRRTTSLGALITVAALGNVVMMNLAYDVSVKLWSINLLVMTVLLLIPDLRRLTDVLLFNRGSRPVRYEPLFQSPRAARIAPQVGYSLLGISLLISVGASVAARYFEYGQEPVALYGIYEVDSFVANGETRPPLLTDELRWRRVVIERSGLASVHLMNGRNLDYFTSLDTIGYTIRFLAITDTTLTAAGATRLAYDPTAIERRVRTSLEEGSSAPTMLAYQRTSPNELVLTGRWAGDTIAARLRRIDESQFLLLTRGVRWVQSYPYFR